MKRGKDDNGEDGDGNSMGEGGTTRGGEDHRSDSVTVGHVLVGAFGNITVSIVPVRADARGRLVLHLLRSVLYPQLRAMKTKETNGQAATAVEFLGKPVLPCAFHPLPGFGFRAESRRVAEGGGRCGLGLGPPLKIQ